MPRVARPTASQTLVSGLGGYALVAKEPCLCSLWTLREIVSALSASFLSAPGVLAHLALLASQVRCHAFGERRRLSNHLVRFAVRGDALQHRVPEPLRYVGPQRVIADLHREDSAFPRQRRPHHFRVAPQRAKLEQLARLRRHIRSKPLRGVAGALLDERDEFGVGVGYLLV